jgi:hypothetical protein
VRESGLSIPIAQDGGQNSDLHAVPPSRRPARDQALAVRCTYEDLASRLDSKWLSPITCPLPKNATAYLA